MHIVVVTGYYYPYMLASAGCINPFLLELSKEHEVEVVCPPSNIHYTKPLSKEGIKINYINSLPNRIISYIKTNQEEHRYPKLTRFLFNVYRGLRFLKSFISLKPYETSLISPCVKMIREIHKCNNIDVLFSVTFPFHTHVAALRFKKEFPSVKWISFSTDPLAYSEANPIEKRKFKSAVKIEQEVYETCDFCITTEELYPNVVNDYLIAPEKVLGKPFLLLERPFEVSRNNNIHHTALYAGLLYIKIRNPQTMIKVFSRIENTDLLLHVDGDRFIRKILRNKYAPNIIIEGLINRQRYLELLGKVDVLINLSNKVKLQAPSKLTELISSGKPIINFYYYKDSAYRMIEKYPLGINIYNDMDIEEAVLKVSSFISENVNKVISFEDIKTLYPEHLLSSQMSKMKVILGIDE